MPNKKVAIITAASRGVGAEVANELHTKGYYLALMSTSGESPLKNADRVISIAGSVTQPHDLQHLLDVTLKKFGHLDAVVNSTGHAEQGELMSLTDECWYNGLDLLLLNVIRMAKLVTPHFLEKQIPGVIVNISAYGALEPTLEFPVSSVMRAGLAAYTKLYAEHYAIQHIRMNSILMGYIDNYAVPETELKLIPMGRPAKITEIAKTVAFLLSEDAGYITGENLRVDGGMSRGL